MTYQKTLNSVSGGETSAFVAANYPADHNVFCIVCLDDPELTPKDKACVDFINNKLEASGFLDVYGEFIATAEYDDIIYTIMDLEQHIGKEIDVVRGISFDEVIKSKGGWLPNKLHRYCTTWMKIVPISEFIYYKIGYGVETRIGYRANEISRVNKMNEKTDSDGFLEIKVQIGNMIESRRKRNSVFKHQKPVFPLVNDGIFKDEIVNYWKDKNVRFAKMNNCVGCFHRNPMLLRKMYEDVPAKMNWFADQEGGKNGAWRSDMLYRKIFDHSLQNELSFDDFSECDSGYCGL